MIRKTESSSMAKKDKDPDILSILSMASWIMMPRFLTHSLSIQAAYLFAHLINVGQMVRASERSDGWFYCTIKSIEREIGMPEQSQRRFIKELERMGFIHTKRKGVPPKKYFWIDVEVLVNELRDFESSRTLPEWGE